MSVAVRSALRLRAAAAVATATATAGRSSSSGGGRWRHAAWPLQSQLLAHQRHQLPPFQTQLRSFSDASAATGSGSGSYEHILTSTPKPGVGLVTLNRPKALNALCTPLFEELNTALQAFDASPDIGAIVITGSEKAFAAGADIKEMASLTFSEAYTQRFIALWTATTTSLRKPLVGAVSGYALGGGCELALMTDVLYCSAAARFGQPEITLGTIPGAGGSQRLSRAIGKSRAMELILTGRMWSGQDAFDWGMAARVFPDAETTLAEALATAEKIASFSKVATMAAKDVVNASQEVGLAVGVELERKTFHAIFGSNDQKIGMKAFVDKNKNPKWTDS